MPPARLTPSLPRRPPSRAALPRRPPSRAALPRPRLRAQNSFSGSFNLCQSNSACDDGVTNTCQCVANYWGDPLVGCTPAVCNATTVDGASFPDTNAGAVAAGTCPVGQFGTISATCVQDTGCGVNGCATGAFDAGTVNSTCQTFVCTPPSGIEYNAAYSTAVDYGQNMTGVCDSATGYTGTIERLCNYSGPGPAPTQILEPPTTACVLRTCPASTAGNADWSETDAGLTVSADGCVDGFTDTVSGTPTRTCGFDGVWSAPNVTCTQLSCAGETAFGATWPAALSGSVDVTGICPPGFSGIPVRNCTVNCNATDGCAWDTSIAGACTQNTCPTTSGAAGDGNATWSQAVAGATVGADGCLDGYTDTVDGTPYRVCGLDGAWGAANVTCTRIYCPVATDDPTATWASLPSGVDAVNGTCNPLYTEDGGVPPQRDCLIDGTWGPVDVACVIIQCPAIANEDGATFDPADAGTASAVGGCVPGYADANLTRSCNATGFWGPITSGVCVRLTCPNDTDFNAFWAEGALSNTTATGTCSAGYRGTPARLCQIDGTWAGSVAAPCELIVCAAESAGNASWPVTVGGDVANGTCDTTYGGAPNRTCNADGTWGDVDGLECVPLYCSTDLSVDNVTFPVTRAGETATGTCDEAGYIGSPTRACNATGDWATAGFDGRCQPPPAPCAADASYDNAAWPETAAGSTANGTCAPGFSSTGGVATRACTLVQPAAPDFWYGAWATNVTGQACAFLDGPEGPSVRITNATATPLSSSELELAWDLLDGATDVWVYQLGASGSGFTELAGPLASSPYNVTGLQEGATYQFRLVPGNETTQDSAGVGVTGTTFVLPPADVAPAAVGADFVTLSWAPGSGLTAYYVIFVSPPLPGPGRRSATPPPGYGVLTNYTTSTTFNATGLLPGTTYSFLVNAAQANGNLLSGAQALSVTTNALPTLAPTTAAPTTAAPTTAAPTTAAPTTAAPTTAVPTTAVPTTAVPTTAVPTTAAPTTAVPTTAVPTTAVPTTATPTTAVPTTAAPTTAAPTTAVPTTAAPTTAAPPTAAPTTAEPTTAAPTTAAPTTATPTSAVPVAAKSNGGAIAGGIIAALIVLAALVLLYFFYLRRRIPRQVPAKHLKESEERASEMSLAATAGTDGDGGIRLPPRDGTVTTEDLRAALVVPNTQVLSTQHQHQEELIAKVLDNAVPAALLLNFQTDLRVDNEVKIGTVPTVSKGTLYDIQAIQRNGAAACLVTTIVDVENEAEAMRVRRLRREVAVMWALSAHANIVRTVGFTESPTTIVTKFYPTDLFRFLFGQYDKAPFDPHVILHLCSAMASAVAVAHSTGIAHRNIQAASFRLLPPATGHLYPEPVLGDFAAARAGYVSPTAGKQVHEHAPHDR